MKRLSVVIVTYNSENHIYECLRSLFQYNDLGDELEVIVVDNQSVGYADMRIRLHEEFGEKVIVEQNSHNGGYGQGNNVGVRLSSAPYIAIMNPDIRLTMPILSELLLHLQKKDVAMCAGKQYAGDGRVWASFFSLFTAHWLGGRCLEFLGRRVFDRYFFNYQYLSGAFFLIRKDVFEQIGMFDEQLFLYAEENDIHARIRKYFPEMKAVYLNKMHYVHLAENRSFSEKHAEMVYKANGFCLRKNGFLPKKYWRDQVKLNKVLLNIYHLKAFFTCNSSYDASELSKRNEILHRLISQE